MSSLMQFSDVLDSMREQDGAWVVAVPDDWMQGRSVFGGLQAAFAVRAMRALLTQQAPLRTLQITFAAPVPGQGVGVRAALLRTGRSATHVEARLVQGDQTLCVATGVFGTARESAIVQLPRQPVVESPNPVEFRFMPGYTPNFTQHFPSRWLRGGLPFTGSTSAEMVVEISLTDRGPASEAHALAIADLIPPIGLTMLKKPAAGSSMTWMIEFFADRFDHLSLERWRVDAQMIGAVDGYTSQSVMVWGPGGEPVAISRQSMVVFG